MKLIVDTNTFLRFLLNDIPSQANLAEELFKSAQNNKKKLLVPQIIIFEVVFALEKYYGFPKQDVIDKIKIILAMDYLKIEDDDIFKDALMLFEGRNISLTDCFLISFAKAKEASIFSFDKKLSKFS